jgi:CubicO group peptidase (beta-lactamase class C family)
MKKTRAIGVVALLGLVALVGLWAQAPPAVAPPDARFDRVADSLQSKMKELGVPGVAFGVLAEGTVRTRGLGVTSADHPLPVTVDTLFQIGSISKTFTGTAMMRLVEQRRLRLDDPVRKYLPRFAVKDPEASAKVTLRDTLTHMSGWEGDFFADPSSGDDALERIVGQMTSLEQTARVGEMWGYNNSGFYVAGRIIEVVTGKPFERAMQELVFEPLGLDQAWFFPADVMTRRFVVGHQAPKDVATVARPWPIPRAASAAGGITTTVPMLLRYAAFHMGDGTNMAGTRVLSPASVTGMRTAVVGKAGTEDAMGLTWHLRRVAGLAVAEHGGSTIGQQALLRLVPERRFAIAVLTNSVRGSTLNTHVMRAAMEAYFGVAPTRPSRIVVAPGALAEYAGVYRRQAQDVTIAVEGDALTIDVTPKMPSLDGRVPPRPPSRRVGFHATDRLIALDGPTRGEHAGEFVRDSSGRVAWLRMGRILRRVTPSGVGR